MLNAFLSILFIRFNYAIVKPFRSKARERERGRGGSLAVGGHGGISLSNFSFLVPILCYRKDKRADKQAQRERGKIKSSLGFIKQQQQPLIFLISSMSWEPSGKQAHR